MGAATIFYFIFWQLTIFEKALWTSCNLRAVAAAVIFTPWYSNPQDTLMAPALMVAALDTMTLGAEAAFRSVVPLILALLFALLLASLVAFFVKRKSLIVIKNKVRQ